MTTSKRKRINGRKDYLVKQGDFNGFKGKDGTNLDLMRKCLNDDDVFPGEHDAVVSTAFENRYQHPQLSAAVKAKALRKNESEWAAFSHLARDEIRWLVKAKLIKNSGNIAKQILSILGS